MRARSRDRDHMRRRPEFGWLWRASVVMLASALVLTLGAAIFPSLKQMEPTEFVSSASIEQLMHVSFTDQHVEMSQFVAPMSWPRCTFNYELVPRRHHYIPRFDCGTKIASRSFAAVKHNQDPCDVFMDD